MSEEGISDSNRNRVSLMSSSTLWFNCGPSFWGGLGLGGVQRSQHLVCQIRDAFGEHHVAGGGICLVRIQDEIESFFVPDDARHQDHLFENLFVALLERDFEFGFLLRAE